MKFVAFSDLHGQYSNKLTKWFMKHPADVLLFAGDLQLNNFDDGTQFLEWLNTLPYKHKVCIFGNHDGNYDYTLQQLSKYDNITFLNNESITIEGIKIWGSPYSVQFLDWWFMKPDNELWEIYNNIPLDVDILMTHTPPFGILDKTIDGYNAGSLQLRNRIPNLHGLKYNICGHIHENFGIESTDGVTFINASILDYKYRLVNGPIEFEI
ncbi:MAG: metallophosphoesterase [Methanomassiliicoccales archaeon]|jgi:Icc-related predicted phosphoesterase